MLMFSSTSLLFPLLFSTLASSLALEPRTYDWKSHDYKELKAHAEVHGPDLGIVATFDFTGYRDGRPTEVKVHVKSGLKDDPTLGPAYAYHIHTNPIPKDGNCTLALSHLDPYNVTESIVCNPDRPEFCQEGDFAGKFGKLKGTKDGSIAPFTFKDSYLRFFPEEASLLGRSIVIHAANKTRIACGNIISPLDGTANKYGKPTYKPSTFVKHLPSKPGFNPPEIIDPFNGTDSNPPQSFVNSLPFPLPFRAISLKRSINIGFFEKTHEVKLKGKKTTVTQPKAFRVTGKGPFYN
jgi:Cu/Zn superoxide dismutase